MDFRVGGQWRFVTRDEGMEIGFHGEYREIAAPHRLVQTEIFGGMPGAEAYPSEPAINTMTLDEADGVTTMTLLIQVPSQEIRDAILASGMEHGLQISYNRLEDLVRPAA
jgi:uncharacterized protein YndB with AHSA1/START domain